MAVPFRRTSKTKKRMRRTHLKKSSPSLTNCPKCNETIKPHRVCLKCGFYKGQEVLSKETLEPEVKSETTTETKPKKATKISKTKSEAK